MEIILTTRADLEEILDQAISRATSQTSSEENGRSVEGKAWLTNEETIAYLGVSRPTMLRLRRRSKIPFSKIGRKVYFRRIDVEALLERNLSNTKPEVA